MDMDAFQKVFDILQPVLPEGWKKMALFVGYTSGSYTMKYYTSDEKGVYTDCFKQKELSKTRLIQIFMNIDKVLSAERRKLDENNKWSVMTMLVSEDGKIKTEFDYSDINDDAIAYEQKWKEKYINL